MGVTARLVARAADIPPEDWDRLAGSANPFARHAFFTSVEDSGSATAEAGWRPLHIVLDGADGRPQAILPGYLKAHSMGEYVFDQSWADAYERAGGRYYPKLQHAVPFTPATAPHLLAATPEAAARLVATSEALVEQNDLSGAHATFLDGDEADVFRRAGWLERHSVQFHWFNAGYGGFDDFLGALRSRKRKVLRHEHEAALAAVDRIEWLTGAALTEEAWDAFFSFYMDTAGRKWGRPYLTRAFFSLIGERMGDAVLLVMAKKGGRYVAGALNFIGADALYGRQWGAAVDIPFLHFEVCYHQAILYAITHGLARVEAGAQGAHKIARGYRPVVMRSMHYLRESRFRDAVADYLDEERALVAAEMEEMAAGLPYHRAG